VRIGVHSGPVVAGIVGLKKFAFDIWGDTGKINTAGATYNLIKNNFNCACRGKIEANNKGKIDIYFVV
jgi:class 3 adenylate cyclase